MNTENLSTENKTEALNKHAVSCKRPYFKISRNDYGKPFFFYSPSTEEGRFNCWMPVNEEFVQAFNEMQEAACASRAVAKGMSVDCSHSETFEGNDGFIYCRHCGQTP